MLTGTHPVSEPVYRRISKIFAQSSNAFATRVRPAGMKNDLASWPRLALAAAVVVTLGAGVTSAAVVVGAIDGDQQPRPGNGVSLVSYDTCDTALAELKSRAMPHVGPYGFSFGDSVRYDMPAEGDAAGRAEAAPMDSAPKATASPEHSNTNVQETGVDEPDLVKTDGRRVVSITDGVLRVVDVASRQQTAAVPLDGAYASQLLVDGDRALVMTTPNIDYGGSIAIPDIARGEPTPTGTPKPAPTDTVPYGSQLVLVDLTGAGKILGTLSVDGSYLDARQVGSVARVVVRSAPHMEFRYPQQSGDEAATLLENKNIVANSTIADWLPRYELTTGGATMSGQLTDCVDVTHPVDYTGTGMLTVLTVDLKRDLGNGDPLTIVADGNTVYGTGSNLYVADDHFAHAMGEEFAPSSQGTELYQFDISAPGKPRFVASGAVDGSLLNQYSLSELDDNLRVATTKNSPTQESMITVLSRTDDKLTQVGQVGGLGVGERIYAVRYMGKTAYVVTFRQTDPLYTVDLSNPTAPKVTGELKITGYSAYLHPAGDGRLIGVGQEADGNGRVQGAQVSLFDTSNPAGARRVAQYTLPAGWLEVEGDPHAFLYWPDKDLLVMPVSGAMDPSGASGQTAGALVLKLNDNSIEQAGILSHQSTKFTDMPVPPRRALVIGNELWTVSDSGMLVNDLDSLAQLAWVPFS